MKSETQRPDAGVADVARLTLRERAAQLMMPRIGSNMPPPVTVAEDLDRAEALLARCPVGGLILFNGRLPEVAETLAALQERSAVPLLISTDMERGVGQQVAGASIFPHAMAFARPGGDADLAAAADRLEGAARVQAREALACGIHITFAPVADVNTNPRNPIIATRAFGTDPGHVGRLVRAYVRGCRAEGLLTTAKHFPGHGDTSQDSHAELPLVDHGRAELEAVDLVPFRAAVEAGVDLVMTAHVVYPALDRDRPATLSRPILHDLLRGDLGFEGAVVTDSLLMGAIRETHADAGAQAVALVEAGVDILLDVEDPEAAVTGLVEAVAAGDLAEARIDEACRRVLGLKQRLVDRFGTRYFTDPSAAVPLGEVGSEAHRRLAREAARAAVHVVDAAPGVLPLADGQGDGDVVAVLIQPHRSRLDPDEQPLGQALRAAFPGVRYFEVGPDADVSTLASIRAAAAQARHVVAAVVVKPAAWHRFGLRPEQETLVRELAAAQPIVLASLGSPYALDGFDGAAARLCTYSDVPASQEALVDVLRG